MTLQQYEEWIKVSEDGSTVEILGAIVIKPELRKRANNWSLDNSICQKQNQMGPIIYWKWNKKVENF